MSTNRIFSILQLWTFLFNKSEKFLIAQFVEKKGSPHICLVALLLQLILRRNINSVSSMLRISSRQLTVIFWVQTNMHLLSFTLLTYVLYPIVLFCTAFHCILFVFLLYSLCFFRFLGFEILSAINPCLS